MASRTITMGSKMAIATAQAKKSGCKKFKKGTACAAKMEQIAEAIGRKNKVVPGPARPRKGKRHG